MVELLQPIILLRGGQTPPLGVTILFPIMSTAFENISAEKLAILPPRSLRTLRLIVFGIFYQDYSGGVSGCKIPMSKPVMKLLFGQLPEIQDFPDILPAVLKTFNDLGVPFEGEQELGVPLLEHAVACLM